MHYNIEIQVKEKIAQSIVTALRSAIIVTLRHENLPPPASLTVLLTDDEKLQHLNQDYRGVDEITDVLSFPADREPVDLDSPDENDVYLGDIAISVPAARRQARLEGHSLKAELQLLTVHGTLHLLEHDHEEPDEKKVMWWAQNSILAQVGADITSPE